MAQIRVATYNIFSNALLRDVHALQDSLSIDILGVQGYSPTLERAGQLASQGISQIGNHWIYSVGRLFGTPPGLSAPVLPAGQAHETLHGLSVISNFQFSGIMLPGLGPDNDPPPRNPGGPGTAGRNAVYTYVNIEGTDLYIINTGTAYTKRYTESSAFRRAQIQMLKRNVLDSIPPDAPTILMGHFNATKNNPDMEPLVEEYLRVPSEELTRPGFVRGAPSQPIDHLFFRNMQLTGTSLHIDSTLSKRPMLIADFRL